jgi:hypothetical protein
MRGCQNLPFSGEVWASLSRPGATIGREIAGDQQAREEGSANQLSLTPGGAALRSVIYSNIT